MDLDSEIKRKSTFQTYPADPTAVFSNMLPAILNPSVSIEARNSLAGKHIAELAARGI